MKRIYTMIALLVFATALSTNTFAAKGSNDDVIDTIVTLIGGRLIPAVIQLTY